MTPEEHRDQHPEWAENGPEHECSKCAHGIKHQNGIYTCGLEEDEDCEFEVRTPTLDEAIKLTECIDIDYGSRNQDEIDEIDKALDVIYAFCRRYTKGDMSSEWEDWIDGQLHVLTDAGRCKKCGIYNKHQAAYCPHCGRKMKGRFVNE